MSSGFFVLGQDRGLELQDYFIKRLLTGQGS